MLLCELAREHGVFDWLSAVAVRKADGSCLRLFTLVYAVGTVVTVFLSNDATAVVLTPAILTAVRRAKVQPLPYLFVCAFIANAGGGTGTAWSRLGSNLPNTSVNDLRLNPGGTSVLAATHGRGLWSISIP